MTLTDKTLHSLHTAALYDQVANYYKYINPSLHISYYQLHLQELTKAISSLEIHTREMQTSILTGKIRFMHVLSKQQNIDVYLNGLRMFRNIPMKKVSNYLTLPAGTFQVDLYPVNDPINTILSKKITIPTGDVVTAVALKGEKHAKLVLVDDQLFVPPGETKIRVAHLSQNTSAIDIAVTYGDVVFRAIDYKQTSPYLGLTPMTVNLEVRKTGTKEVILPLPKLTFTENNVYTIYLLEAAPLEAWIIA